MFKVGDKVRFKDICSYYSWYSEKVFTVINVDLKYEIVSLDEPISKYYGNCVEFDFIIHDLIYQRKQKIEKIKERCLKLVI